MAGRPLRIEWREGDDVATLKARYRAEERSEVRLRLHGLWLLRSGRSVRESAAALGVHERTVQRWVQWYRAGGVATVCTHRQGGVGQGPWLTAAQQAQVVAEVARGAFRTAEEVRQWIAQQYGVTYTPGGIYTLLGRLRCAPKVPRPVHSHASPEAQEAWKKGGSRPPSKRED